MKSISELKAQLSAMDDSSLGILISTVAQASGADKDRVQAMVSDIPGLRRAINAMSEAQFSQLLSSMGRSGTDDILKKLLRSR